VVGPSFSFHRRENVAQGARCIEQARDNNRRGLRILRKRRLYRDVDQIVVGEVDAIASCP
jgi:hypothetical protein